MRVLHAVVSSENRDTAREALEERDYSLIVIPLDDTDGVLLEVPLPSNAIGDAFDALEEEGIELEEYTVVTSGEAAMTPTSETLEQRYAGSYDPLTGVELRSKARDLSRDRGSYAALMILSALIATAGLLINSPAIVVGSMVIAPIVGPALTAGVGTVTGDRGMIGDSLWMQLYGLGLAIAASALLAASFRFGGFVAPTLDLPALDLFGVRLAPNALSLVVGAAAGTAAGIGLTTKGPTSIIGVMISAALIPTAAASGIAVAWLEPNLAIGTAVLLVATLVVVNLAVLTVLVVLGYHRRERPSTGGETDWSWATVGAILAVCLVLTLIVGVATAQQTITDREVAQATDDAINDPAHDNLTVISIQTQYADMSPFTGPREVTVTVSETGDAAPDELATDIATEIEERTDESVAVRVHPQEYEYSSAGDATASEFEAAGSSSRSSLDTGFVPVTPR
ncbi:DUF389 domain-containing protein [Natronoglomus mannanivorans]|uniref:DUF389 domain-containing protein n=1 Tax=Natronoglomus mannanivorans TaxID=2979990 RepID=A0AAP2Z2H8_9EURY|nr:DUF389 domain-containing protein [Halobacteria archaeon AArc-xg1-1]